MRWVEWHRKLRVSSVNTVEIEKVIKLLISITPIGTAGLSNGPLT